LCAVAQRQGKCKPHPCASMCQRATACPTPYSRLHRESMSPGLRSRLAVATTSVFSQQVYASWLSPRSATLGHRHAIQPNQVLGQRFVLGVKQRPPRVGKGRCTLQTVLM
jgi:hypothetical protein